MKMKIASADIGMTSHSLSLSFDTEREKVEFWVDRPAAEGWEASSQGGRDRLSLSAAAIRRRMMCCPDSTVVDPAPAEESGGLDPRFAAMRRILEVLTGRRITVASFQGQAEGAVGGPGLVAGGQPSTPAGERAGWGLVLEAETIHAEADITIFAAGGAVTTADGTQYAISLEMSMARFVEEQTSLTLRAGDARFVDPLVVNFHGQPARLGDVRLGFDLDSDGTAEEIAFLAPGSGFLVWDRNNDGVVSNGSELFGPVSGHGFAELAGHDADGNGWLDENDPLFAKLRVWMSDQAGLLSLRPLTELGIGALLLTPIDTPFVLDDAAGLTAGRIRQTSLALFEEGAATTVQEIDLVV
ncbi:MAG: hypothetical protein ACOY4H_14660 [Thermodesulfobacteriota bacterium]